MRERYYITKVATQTRGENIGYPIKFPGTIGFTYHISNKDKFQMDQDLNIKHETIKILKENMEGFHPRPG